MSLGIPAIKIDAKNEGESNEDNINLVYESGLIIDIETITH